MLQYILLHHITWHFTIVFYDILCTVMAFAILPGFILRFTESSLCVQIDHTLYVSKHVVLRSVL